MRGSFSLNIFAYKAFSMLICLLLVIGCFSNVVFADDSNPISENDFEGSGTQYDPYLINNYEDLCLFRDLVDGGNRFNGKYFVQTDDISIPDGVNWNGIGDYKDTKFFAGVYNGKGYSIYNLFCSDEYAALFSYSNGQIWNLGIESGCICGDYVGSIVSHGGYNCEIINCYNKAEVHGVIRVGGIVNNSNGVTMFCINLGNVYGDNLDTIVAGINPRGEGLIKGCFSITDNLVDNTNFSGNIVDSYNANDYSVQDYLEQYYQMMYEVYSEQRYPVYSFDNEKDIAAINFGESDNEDNKEFTINNWGNIYTTVDIISYDGVQINRENIVFLTGDDIHFDSDYEPDAFLAEKESYKDSFIDLYDSRFDFEGEGTKENPFKINSFEDLCLLRDCVNINVTYYGYYFVLTDDIYFDDQNWIPIGLPNIATGFPNQNDKGRSFTGFLGTLDGNGHVLYNLNCESMFAGLFGHLDGRVVNLGIESGVIKGNYSGSIACSSGTNAEIINCYNKASVYGIYRAGGIADYYCGKLVYCWNFGDVDCSLEHSTIASICSYGSAEIYDSYSVGDLQIVPTSSFTGTLLRSGSVDSYSGENYDYYYELIRNEVIDATTLLSFSNGDNISFSSDVVVGNNALFEFVPQIVLFVFALFGVIILICNRKKIKFEKRENNNSKVKADKTPVKIHVKRLGCVFLTVIVLTVEIYLTSATLQNKYTTGVTPMQNYYLQNDVDVLFLGTSRSGLNFDGEVLWNEYGLNSYNLWGSVATIWNSYYYLKEAIEVKKPKIVLLETNSIIYSEVDYHHDDYLQLVNTIAIRNPINRLEDTIATVDNDEVIDYMLKLPLYHERVFDLKEDDFKHYFWSEGLSEDKGFHTNNLQQINSIESGVDVVNYYAISEKGLYYLEGIIDLCKDNDVQLILIKSEIPNVAIQQPFFNTLSLIAEEHDVPYINFNYLYDETGFNISDFGDGHLNTRGSRKNSEYLGQYIVENYPELVSDNNRSWDISAARLQNSYIQYITDNEEYFSELSRDNKKILVINYRCDNTDSSNYNDFFEQLDSVDYSVIENFSIGNGEEYIIEKEFGSHSLVITPEYAKMTFEIDSSDFVEINTPCFVVIVYDEISDEVADITCFPKSNGYTIKHIYPNATN